MPPKDMFQSFAVAGDVAEWVRLSFLEEDSPLYNEDHQHLLCADIGYLWTDFPNRRAGQAILGQAQMPNFKGDKWAVARQEYQLQEWFGFVPDFFITLSSALSEFSDAGFCAVVEHELYHCGQVLTWLGMPKRTKQGKPVFTMRGHDYEGFVGTVKRYGITEADAKMIEFIEATKSSPVIAEVNVRAVCGTCR